MLKAQMRHLSQIKEGLLLYEIWDLKREMYSIKGAAIIQKEPSAGVQQMSLPSQ